MLRKLRPRITYANVVSTLALGLAVGGGTAYAATKISTSNLRYHAVTGSKLATNAVTRIEGQEQRAVRLRPPRQLAHVRGHQQRHAAGDRLRRQPAPRGPKGDPGAPATSIFGVVTADGGLTAGGRHAHVRHAGERRLRRVRSARTSASAPPSPRSSAARRQHHRAADAARAADHVPDARRPRPTRRARSSSPSTASRLTDAGRVGCAEHAQLAPLRSSWPADDERAGADALAVPLLRPRPEAGPDVPVVDAVDEPDPAAVVSPRLAQLELRTGVAQALRILRPRRNSWTL